VISDFQEFQLPLINDSQLPRQPWEVLLNFLTQVVTDTLEDSASCSIGILFFFDESARLKI
jgi:hypothetical protein